MAETKSTSCRGIDSTGSRYALEVAFRTMKERCHKLQSRLSQLEEENTRLRLSEKRDKTHSIENGAQMQSLKDIITQLEQDKKQLSHHVYMVTSENKHLWSCLSQSEEANKLLGSHLTQISDTFTQHPLNRVAESQINKKTPSILLSQSANTSPLHTATEPDTKDSLEEISLKLINSLQQEKSELEDQYAQMIALHGNDLPLSFPTDNLSQSLLVDMMNSENGSLMMLAEVKEHKSTLLQLKDSLKNQQLQLQTALENLKKFKADKTPWKIHAPEPEKEIYSYQETAVFNQGLSLNCRSKPDSEDSYSEPVPNPKQQLGEEKPVETVQNNSLFHPCEYSRNILSSTDLPQSDTPSLNTSDSNDVDLTCPICSKEFPYQASFDALNQHVQAHFDLDYVYVDNHSK